MYRIEISKSIIRVLYRKTCLLNLSLVFVTLYVIAENMWNIKKGKSNHVIIMQRFLNQIE